MNTRHSEQPSWVGSKVRLVTSADDANFQPSRFEAALEAGTSTRYQLAEGKSLEFACQGQIMNVKSLETTAAH